MSLAETMADVLSAVMSVESADDGVLTLRHDDTVALVRIVTIADGLEMVSLTQMLAWDLPADPELFRRVVALGQTTMLGTVTLAELPGGHADVLLRYNFPAGRLDDRALQTLMLMVLAAGAAARDALV